MSAKVPGTQRAWACWDNDEPRTCEYVLQDPQPNIAADEFPVLVVPEAAVRGCDHSAAKAAQLDWCSVCGSREAYQNRWQRPRILRVAKEKKR